MRDCDNCIRNIPGRGCTSWDCEYINRGKAIETYKRSQWIPVSERMPSEPFGCLVTVIDTEPMTCEEFENLLPYFVGWDGEQWNDGEGERCPFEVIAWMPLPEPWGGE